VIGSAAATSGWACAAGASAHPDTYCSSNGSGAVAPKNSVCYRNGNGAVGALSGCYSDGNVAENTPSGNACASGLDLGDG